MKNTKAKQRFAANAGRTFGALLLILFVPAYFGLAYLEFLDLEAGKIEYVTTWKGIIFLYNTLGINSLLAVTVISPIIGVILLVISYVKAKELKAEIGEEELDNLKYERAVEERKKLSSTGVTPEHLQSKENYKAYEKRVKFLFILMAVVFALVGIGVATGIIT